MGVLRIHPLPISILGSLARFGNDHIAHSGHAMDAYAGHRAANVLSVAIGSPSIQAMAIAWW
jgi:hypothetical protein